MTSHRQIGYLIDYCANSLQLTAQDLTSLAKSGDFAEMKKSASLAKDQIDRLSAELEKISSIAGG